MNEIIVNGEKRNVPEGIFLSELIDQLELPQRRIAVELNKDVIRKSLWAETRVSDDDVIEVVHFVGGG